MRRIGRPAWIHSAKQRTIMPGRCIRELLFMLLFCAGMCAESSGQTFGDFLTRVASAAAGDRPALVDSFLSANPAAPLIEGDSTAHFLYRGPASNVSVAGDANGWSPDASPMQKLAGTDLWYRSDRYEEDARLDYKFVVDGAWRLDARNPRQMLGGFGPNSELRMPRYPQQPEIGPHPGIPRGTIRDTNFHSSALGNTRQVRIYLPPGYDSSSDHFPVVLFHDGLEYLSIAGTDAILDWLIAERRIPPVIGVFVPPVNRTDEYAGKQLSAYARFLVTEVMTAVDRRYRTRAEASQRATLGASNGGNIALYLGTAYPDAFGNAAAQSSNIVSAISETIRTGPRLAVRFYLDLGTYDIAQLIPLVRDFAMLLREKGYPFRYAEFHEGHSWGNWQAHIDDALVYFFGVPPTDVKGDGARPHDMILDQNHPNPFDRRTTCTVRMAASADVSVRVYDLTGRERRTLYAGALEPGLHAFEFDDAELGAGTYILAVATRTGSIVSRKIIVR